MHCGREMLKKWWMGWWVLLTSRGQAEAHKAGSRCGGSSSCSCCLLSGWRWSTWIAIWISIRLLKSGGIKSARNIAVSTIWLWTIVRLSRSGVRRLWWTIWGTWSVRRRLDIATGPSLWPIARLLLLLLRRRRWKTIPIGFIRRRCLRLLRCWLVSRWC